MPTLGVNIQLTLATDRTRQSLDEFYRGIKVEAAQILPFSYISDKEEITYDIETASFVLFIGDVYDDSEPFDVVLVNYEDEEICLKQTNFFFINATNFKKLILKSSVEDKIGYKLYYG